MFGRLKYLCLSSVGKLDVSPFMLRWEGNHQGSEHTRSLLRTSNSSAVNRAQGCLGFGLTLDEA